MQPSSGTYIPHQDILMMVGNPYLKTIQNWDNISYSRRQVIRSEYPEIPEISRGYERWDSRQNRINEGVEDCSLDFAMFANGIRTVVGAATTAWKLFFRRKVTETAVRNAPKIEKILTKFPTTKGYASKVKDELKALRDKYTDLEKARKKAVKIETLPDGRIRYYAKETPAHTNGKMRGAGMVTEYNPKTNDVRQWMETRDHLGNVKIVHPKTINGVKVNVPHYPHISKDILEFGVKK